MLMLRETSGSISIKRLKLESGVDLHVLAIQPYVSWNVTSTIIYDHERKVWCQGMMPEHDCFLLEK